MPVDCSLFLYSCSPPTPTHYLLKSPFEFSGMKSRMAELHTLPSSKRSLKSCLAGNTGVKESDTVIENEIKMAILSDIKAVSKTNGKVKLKKRVTFADSNGLALTSVRIMQEPSDLPPALNIQAIGDLTIDEIPQPSATHNYILDFRQPASDYLEFRDKLERQNVSLENVIIKDNTTIMGTVKVKNISYHKTVKIRMTCDKWANSKDVSAVYVPSTFGGPLVGASATPERYDSFSFEFQIPSNSEAEVVEFCVFFECNGQFFWDNNGGTNYRIISERWKTVSQHEQLQDDLRDLRINDNLSWSEFAYWKTPHTLEENLPYW
ncbi:protein phosphatase 1 regulatory subunit 3B-like [Saccoglossus kowalevskii]|uniref:Protein phosphatase 1 regulatory subunit n=1 Tax=Saccoglossus kowalevskii TaxID=10224 RepID=A0ABM0N059_SACKO|nr:PREDICTED: protein phosphatase 1 regulatory subunit 3B-like [Saccoglossus kowalevskii]